MPLEAKYKEVIADNLDWHDLLWTDSALRVIKHVAPKEDDKNGGGDAPSQILQNQSTTEQTIGIYSPLMNFKLYDIKNGAVAVQSNWNRAQLILNWDSE